MTTADTKFTSAQVTALTGLLLGEEAGRSASKSAAISRFVATADGHGLKGAVKLLALPFAEAEAAIRAHVDSHIEAEPEPEPVPVEAPAKPKGHGVTLDQAFGGDPLGMKAAAKKAKAMGDDKPAKADEAKPAKKEPKTAVLLRRALNGGITNTEMRELTGWKKLGGFFNAAKKANLTLHRERVDGDTRWTATAQEG